MILFDISLRRLAKPSIKSAITYTMERDLRDPSSANLVGSYFKTVLEYAGLGGDTSFMKMETQASVSDMLSEGWVCIQYGSYLSHGHWDSELVS